MEFMIFISVFFVACSHLLILTLGDQFSHPVAGFEEYKMNPSFLGRRRAVATGGIAAIITLSLVLIFNKRKQATADEGSGFPSPEVLRCFLFSEIVSATKNFSRPSFIGRQGFQDVYEGFIDDGKQRVTIIRLSDLWNEVKALSKLRHENLVSLVGYCNASSGMFLVYEYSMHPLSKTPVSSNNLQTNITSLSWPQRLKICIGAARGLDYLHTCTDGGITHGDLKSSDILLDENYKPKIAYFGLTKLEKPIPSHSPQKSDVYSFGIMLLEVLCGKTSQNSTDQLTMTGRAKSLTGDGSIDRMIDPCLNGQISPNCLKEFVGILRKCLRDDPEMRPTMVQVVARLELLPDSNNVCGKTRAAATEPMCNVARQNVLWAKFVDATGDLNEKHIWYSGPAYKIYKGIHHFGSRETPYIIYRGNNMHDDISKLTELSNLSHPSLASLKGYCCKSNEIFVGYKNEGSLLFDYYWDNFMYLSWSSRLKICIGVAEAIKCMHASNIIHGGICPFTVLVDSSYCAKLATFATVSRLWNSIAYNGLPLPLPLPLPPDIAGSAQVTEKTDVYLFGVLLLIVFCGKKMDYSGGYPFLLQNKLNVAMDQRTLWNVTDMNLMEIECSLNEFLEVAFDCSRLKPADRPSMDTVVECLKEAQALQYG